MNQGAAQAAPTTQRETLCDTFSVTAPVASSGNFSTRMATGLAPALASSTLSQMRCSGSNVRNDHSPGSERTGVSLYCLLHCKVLSVFCSRLRLDHTSGAYSSAVCNILRIMASSCRNCDIITPNCGLYTVYNHNLAILYSKKGSIVATIWQISTIYAELYTSKFLLAYTLYNVNPVSA